MAEWQTRRSQKPLSASSCGFDSHCWHHQMLSQKMACFVDQFPMTPTIEPGEGAVVATSGPGQWAVHKWAADQARVADDRGWGPLPWRCVHGLAVWHRLSRR